MAVVFRSQEALRPINLIDRQMAKYDDLDTKQIFTIGISSVVITAVTILAVQYVYFLLVAGHEAQFQAESSYARQNAILNAQSAEISKYGADPTTGYVTIPIEQAMELVAKESQADSDNHADHATDNDAT
ncbi:hypothetical protein NHH03_15585 [Stieleria sp. TO1_6]|uniref:hypothetical protein n=1 Tax=Stieleria tagensis TaxID=2956795 RepID=UPI00209AF8F0|nr:hypothetical protein [Stieleria tagensis]MCO8123170.1 hypothetical protein [Stieleria tagensis]